jgi:undecaprenyl-diphosphatase
MNLRLFHAAVLLGAIVLASRSASADPPAGPAPSALASGQHFQIDPVADGVLTLGGAGFAALLGLVLSTGEIQATTPGPTSNLLSFDRGAVTQTIDSSADTISNIILYGTGAFALIDPILSGARDGFDAFLVDAVMYAETVAITETLTDLTKIAVRRPRPIDYLNCSQNAPSCANNTDLQLSFFSGHASTVGAISATATYLAFVRDPGSVRAWTTLGVGTALTAFVSYERVRSGNHFPTDVIAGSLAGAAVGVLVPHLHRHKEEAPPVWIGAAPTPGGGGSVTLGGAF